MASRYRTREDFASFTYEFINVFQEFAEKGHWEGTFPTKRQALALRIQLYKARLMMQAARATDPIAQELFPAAQYMYIEIDPVDASRRGKDDAWTLHIIVDPLSRITYGDKLPWKEENYE